jgi:CMP-2-keto-3-deoxyoctulosonic acid synthetase
MKTRDKAMDFFKSMDKKLKCTDFKSSVALYHLDGSRLYFNSALIHHKFDWICCFTEHHGMHIYHRDDLEGYDNWDDTSYFCHNRMEEGLRSEKALTWRNKHE